MKKTLIFLLCCFVLGVIFKFNLENTFVSAGETDFQKFNPTEISMLFWKFSKTKDFENIEKIITKVPASYETTCVETIDSKISPVLPETKIEAFLDETNLIKKYTDDSSLKLLRDYSQNLSYTPLSDLIVVREYMYENEAVVDTEYRIGKHLTTISFYLVKEDKRWRIFLASLLEKESFRLSYAKARLPCKSGMDLQLLAK